MRTYEVALIEWPEGVQAGGPRVIGRVDDPRVVEQIRARIAADRRRELARLERPCRLVPDGREPPDRGSDAPPRPVAS